MFYFQFYFEKLPRTNHVHVLRDSRPSRYVPPNQTWTIMNKHESKTTILIEPQKAWLDRNKNIFGYFGHYFISGDILSDINFYLSDISLKCFDVESLPVSLTATYSMHPLYKPCCFERLFESGIHGRITLWNNYKRRIENRNCQVGSRRWNWEFQEKTFFTFFSWLRTC